MTPIFESDIENFVIELLVKHGLTCSLPKLIKGEIRVKDAEKSAENII